MATYWELEYKQGESGTWTTLSSTIPEGTAYYDHADVFAPGVTYYGRVRRVVDSAPEIWSKEFLAVYSTTVKALVADELVVGSPKLGTPALGQAHGLGTTALTISSPVLGTPSLTENAPDVDALTAVDLVVDSPVLGTPSLGQIHVLGSDGLVTGAPVLGTPSLEIGKDHLAASDLVVEGPVLGAPALQQIHALVADFSTSTPVLDAPALRQVHTLVADGLSVSSPILGSPILFDLECVLQTRAELKSTGTTDFTASSFGTTHIELRCYGNYEVNEFGE